VLARRFGPRPYEHCLPLLARIASTGATDLEGSTPRAETLFLEAALFHGVAGQVLAATRNRQISLTDDGARGLEMAHLRSTALGALLRQELHRVGPVIAAACAGRAPILIKGPALADRFYAEPWLRPFVDLDFLVPHDRVDDAAAALSDALGYRRTALPWPHCVERHAHAVEMTRPLGRHTLGLELHWRISDDPQASGLEYDRLATGAGQLTDPSHDVLVCGHAAQLVVLATHLLHHSGSEKRLMWLVDIAAVAEQTDESEWHGAFLLADSLGLEWVLHTALDETERRLGFVRPRSRRAPRPIAWGPLRAAHVIGGPVGYHLGHLATLAWRGRASYLANGAAGRLGVARRRLGRGRQ
jgi:hypothetical protein